MMDTKDYYELRPFLRLGIALLIRLRYPQLSVSVAHLEADIFITELEQQPKWLKRDQNVKEA